MRGYINTGEGAVEMMNYVPCYTGGYCSYTALSLVYKSKWQCTPCTNGQTIPCYTGPGGTAGVGECKTGTQTCTNGQWGACINQVLPAAEVCGDCLDNNCDGRKDEGCCRIESFGGLADYLHNPPILDPVAGGNLTFTGSISGTCNYPTTWKVTVPEMESKTYSGAGTSVSATWDGKKNDNTVVEEGSYTALLEASTAVCPNLSASKRFTVKKFCDMYEPTSCCKLMVTFGSSANVLNGNLYHSQTLFTIPNSKLLGDFTLSYNSLDSYSGPLGKSWTHSYNINLRDDVETITVMEGDGKKGMLYWNGSTYTPKNSSWPTLTKNTGGTYLLTHKDGLKYSFNQAGKISAITDRNSNTTILSYNETDNLASIADSSNRVISLTYDTLNRISTVTDPNGNIHSFAYTNGHLTSVATTTPDQYSLGWAYTYDANGYMLTKTDSAGYTTTYTYDSNHRVKTSLDPQGGIRSITYPTDITGPTATTTVIEKDGGSWLYTFDTVNGQLVAKTDPLGGATTYTYDNEGHTIATTDPSGSTTTYTYDSAGNMISATDASGSTTTYTYNDHGQVTSITDADGKTSYYTYDNNGNMTTFTDASGETTIYVYDAHGNVSTITSPDGRASIFVYDGLHFLQFVTDASGSTTAFTYDIAGNMTSQTDAAGNTTTFEYNSLNQLVTVTDSQGNHQGLI